MFIYIPTLISNYIIFFSFAILFFRCFPDSSKKQNIDGPTLSTSRCFSASAALAASDPRCGRQRRSHRVRTHITGARAASGSAALTVLPVIRRHTISPIVGTRSPVPLEIAEMDTARTHSASGTFQLQPCPVGKYL